MAAILGSDAREQPNIEEVTTRGPKTPWISYRSPQNKGGRPDLCRSGTYEACYHTSQQVYKVHLPHCCIMGPLLFYSAAIQFCYRRFQAIAAIVRSQDPRITFAFEISWVSHCSVKPSPCIQHQFHPLAICPPILAMVGALWFFAWHGADGSA